MEPVKLIRNNSDIEGYIKITGSKAISIRLLIMKALAGSKIRFENLSDSDDVKLLKFYLSFFDTCANSRIAMIVDAGGANAVMRFVTAYASIREGKWLITGNDNLKEHSIAPLVDALREMDADIFYTEKEGFPPVKIYGKPLRSTQVTIDAGHSSHFVSALMLIAPLLPKGLLINFKGKPVSRSYIKMTEYLMKQAGINIELNDKFIKIEPGKYKLSPVSIEPDWGNASYWYELAAFSDNADIFIEGLQKNSIQGGVLLADIFESFGVKTEFEENGVRIKKSGNSVEEFVYDFSDIPDLAIPVMVTCAATHTKGTFKGLNKSRLKENVRIEVLEKELAKIGAEVKYSKGTVTVIPVSEFYFDVLEIDAYNDHKLAMSFAPLALKVNELKIYNPGTVKKSYPGFWQNIDNFGVEVNVPDGLCS